MTDEALAYYLPAFIRKYLYNREDSDLIPLNLLSLLTPEPGNERWFHALANRLSLPQKKFIVNFLEYVRDDHTFYSTEAEVALASYWGRAAE